MSQYKKCIVISDSHGYYDVFVQLLNSVGIEQVDGRWRIPEDLQLIHLGDAVDRGPDSPGVFNALREMQEDHGQEQVIRLIGNHELCWSGGPAFYQSHADQIAVSPLVPGMIEDGKSGALSFGYSLRAGDKDWLCVHGGLDLHYEAEHPEKKPQDWADHLNALGVRFFNETLPRRAWGVEPLPPEVATAQQELREATSILTSINAVRGGYDDVSGVTWCDILEDLLPQHALIMIPQIVGHRAHPEVTIYPGGRLVGVNVPYGTAQGLLVDLVTGEMAKTEHFGAPDTKFYG